MRHFIFGYGSLICPLSRAVTAPSLKDAIAEPTVISHIERTWSARVSKCQVRQQARQQQRRQHHHSNDDDDDSVRDNNNDNGGDVCDDDDDDDTMMIRGWTPMGVRFRRGAECNGVLIRVDDAELSRFDAREVGYLRRRIDLADVHPHVDDDDYDYDYAMEEGGGGGGSTATRLAAASAPRGRRVRGMPAGVRDGASEAAAAGGGGEDGDVVAPAGVERRCGMGLRPKGEVSVVGWLVGWLGGVAVGGGGCCCLGCRECNAADAD